MLLSGLPFLSIKTGYLHLRLQYLGRGGGFLNQALDLTWLAKERISWDCMELGPNYYECNNLSGERLNSAE